MVGVAIAPLLGGKVACSVSSWPTEYDWERYVFGVGWRGIENGMLESPDIVLASGLRISSPLLVDVEGGIIVEVGD